MPVQREFLIKKNYSYYPCSLTRVMIDGEQVLLGPIIYALMQERNVPIRAVARLTSCHTVTLKDFLRGTPTKRASGMGIAITSQIMQTAGITLPDIVNKAREMRDLCPTTSCISPTVVAPLADDGRMEERTTP